MNRFVNVMILKPDKSTEWITVPWGKAHLDWIRKQGNVILMTV